MTQIAIPTSYPFNNQFTQSLAEFVKKFKNKVLKKLIYSAHSLRRYGDLNLSQYLICL